MKLRRPVNSAVGHARRIWTLSLMLRNCIAIVAGALLYFVLSFAGTELMGFLVLRNVGSLTDQQVLMRLTLWETFVVWPTVAVIVGAFFASLVQRRFWWLAGVLFIPVLIYGLVINFHDVSALEIILFTGQVILGCLAAFVFSRFKRMPNNSLDRSGGSMFRIKHGTAKVE